MSEQYDTCVLLGMFSFFLALVGLMLAIIGIVIGADIPLVYPFALLFIATTQAMYLDSKRGVDYYRSMYGSGESN